MNRKQHALFAGVHAFSAILATLVGLHLIATAHHLKRVKQ